MLQPESPSCDEDHSRRCRKFGLLPARMDKRLPVHSTLSRVRPILHQKSGEDSVPEKQFLLLFKRKALHYVSEIFIVYLNFYKRPGRLLRKMVSEA